MMSSEQSWVRVKIKQMHTFWKTFKNIYPNVWLYQWLPLVRWTIKTPRRCLEKIIPQNYVNQETSKRTGVDRLSAPILSIFTIIYIGHFQNRFADNLFFFFFMLLLPLIWYVGSHESDQSTRKTEGSLTPRALANWSCLSDHASVVSQR